MQWLDSNFKVGEVSASPTRLGEDMADVRLIKLTWENEDEFKMESQLNGG